MNKNYLIFGTVAVVILILGVGGIFFYQNKSQSQDLMMSEKANETESMMKKDDQTTNNDSMTGSEAMMKEGTRYIGYSSNTLSEAKESKIILFFYANWCPICRPADKEFQENSDRIPSNTVLIRVNYNDTDTDQEEKDLAKKYGVTYQHTFVQIDENGNEVTKWSGGGIDDLLANIK